MQNILASSLSLIDAREPALDGSCKETVRRAGTNHKANQVGARRSCPLVLFSNHPSQVHRHRGIEKNLAIGTPVDEQKKLYQAQI